MGLGGGIAFAEYSTFQYAGVKTFDDAMTVTESFGETIYEEEGPIEVHYDHGGTAVLKEDASLSDDEIIFELTYNKAIIRPYIAQSSWERGEEGEMFTSFGIYADGNVDLALVMKIKDEILDGLKKKVVFSYLREDNGITGCTIKISPSNMERIQIRQ